MANYIPLATLKLGIRKLFLAYFTTIDILVLTMNGKSITIHFFFCENAMMNCILFQKVSRYGEEAKNIGD